MSILADMNPHRTLYILDQGLRNLGGHYFEYARSIAEAAKTEGLRCVVACHKKARRLDFDGGSVQPVFSHGVWEVLPGESYPSPGNLRGVSRKFVEEARGFVARFAVRNDDIVFMPNIANAHVLAAALLAEELGPRGIHLCFMFRYPSHFFEGKVAKEAFVRLGKAAAVHSVSLCTDSHRLAEELGRAFRLRFRVLPIPHTDRARLIADAGGNGDGPVHFVSLGNARGEKGIREIFAAVRLGAGEPWADRVRFTIQTNDPYEAEDAIAEFLGDPDPRVTLVDRVLDSEAYYRLLAAADVVLTPYHRDVYRERTSGVFLEALLAGKIALCTEDTWMSDLLEAHGGGLAVADRSPEAICDAMGEIVQRYRSFKTKAEAAADYWRLIHSPENLIRHLTGAQARPVELPKSRKALLVFPWGDALSGKSGSSVRLRLLVRYLERHYSSVLVLYAAVSEPGGKIGARSTAEPYYYYGIRAKSLQLLIWLFATLFGARKEQTFHLWYHIWPRLDRRLRARCRELVQWADDVYAEYSYFAPVLDPPCRKLGKPLRVTVHDILSDQMTGVPLVHAATRALELGAFKRASRLYTVSEADRDALRGAGLSSTLIPHPIDADEALPIFLPEERSAILATLLDLQDNDRRLCFFVGSDYRPNREAAAFIANLAARMREDPRARAILFIVAGSCMEPARDGNFVALGPIENAILSALYERADIVLIPLTEGTGVSVKSIEALARGALVLSTRVGMRGLAVKHGRHCLIEDDFSSYPARILEILNNPDEARAIRAAAMKFGLAYDYRLLFCRYFDDEDPPEEAGGVEREDAIVARRRREAAEELLPRIESLPDNGSRSRLSDMLGLNESSAARSAAMNAAKIQRSPVGRSFRRVVPSSLMKRMAVVIPPIRRLYNHRNNLLDRVADLEDSRRVAEERSTVLVEERNALLARTADLENRLRIAEEQTRAAGGELLSAERRNDGGASLSSRLDAIEGRFSGIEVGLREFADRLAVVGSFADRHFPIWAYRIDLQMHDLLKAQLASHPLPRLDWRIVAQRSIACDTNDHLFPRGTKNDNTRHPRFVRACEGVLGQGPIRHLDLGCAGGGLVWDFSRRGHWSVGVEGSDYSLREGRAEWQIIPDRLFTADICYPFHFEDGNGDRVLFDIVSAWELFEHIPEAALGQLLRNITLNLRPNGYLVASIATFPDQDAATGTVYHHTVRAREWWQERFRGVDLVAAEGIFDTGDFVRGSGNPTAYDWDVRRNPELGFHVVLRYEPR